MRQEKVDTDRNRDTVIIKVFQKYYRDGMDTVHFSMDDIRDAIKEVAKKNPNYGEKNVADLRYQYTSGRRSLPTEIDRLGPWMIMGTGKGAYAFVRVKEGLDVSISADLQEILIPDATPEIVVEYAGRDEQGLLAKLRYNRLLDIFLGITCYHLQNHWRTTVNKVQREIDDLYVGIDVDGRQYVIPVEAKGRKDRVSKTQIVQMVEFAGQRYPRLIIRPVGIQEITDKGIVLILFTPGKSPDDIKIKEMRRYKLVPMSQCPVNEPRE
jgi:hypothetical protein